MKTRTIKDVGEKTWRKMKTLSAEYNMTMGKLLEKITEDYEKRNKDLWNEILYGKKIFTKKEADEMKAVVRDLRKEYGFR